jgi:hypothetical protein
MVITRGALAPEFGGGAAATNAGCALAENF